METPDSRTGLRSIRRSRGRLLPEIPINGSTPAPLCFRPWAHGVIWAEACTTGLVWRKWICPFSKNCNFRKDESPVPGGMLQYSKPRQLRYAELDYVLQWRGQSLRRVDQQHGDIVETDAIRVEAGFLISCSHHRGLSHSR